MAPYSTCGAWATCAYPSDPGFFGSAIAVCGQSLPGFNAEFQAQRQAEIEVQIEEQKAAELKARELMDSIIGSEQGEIYKNTLRVIVKPGKYFWVIGNVNQSFREGTPFRGKPCVIRIDNPDKLHITSFCVEQHGGEPTPYTDKVITFVTHLVNDEKAFVQTINRIRESTIKEVPECAEWPQ